MARDDVLLGTFVELADTLVDDFDVLEFAHRLTERSVSLLGVGAAGLMLADPAGGLRLLAASSERMRLLELFELQAADGPCLDCYHVAGPVAAADLEGADGRWPHFAPAARSAGFRSVNAVPLRLRARCIGALNLFLDELGGLGAEDVLLAQALADVATIGILQERAVREARLLAEQLHSALNSRVVIEQAKGLLAERLGIEVDEAFDLLRGYARATNRRLGEVATEVATRRLDANVLAAHTTQPPG